MVEALVHFAHQPALLKESPHLGLLGTQARDVVGKHRLCQRDNNASPRAEATTVPMLPAVVLLEARGDGTNGLSGFASDRLVVLLEDVGRLANR